MDEVNQLALNPHVPASPDEGEGMNRIPSFKDAIKGLQIYWRYVFRKAIFPVIVSWLIVDPELNSGPEIILPFLACGYTVSVIVSVWDALLGRDDDWFTCNEDSDVEVKF